MSGTEDTFPESFSPDGQWLLVSAFAELPRVLKRVPLGGGPAITIGETPDWGATWWPDDTIIQGSRQGLWSMPSSGAERTQLTTVADQELAHIAPPRFLPNGRAVLFTIWSGVRNASQVAVYDLDSGQRRPLLAGTSPRFAASWHLVFWREGSLWAAPFDPDALELRDDPIPLVEGVQASGSGFAGYGVGANGTLMYLPAGGVSGQSLVWVDRDGNEEPLPAPPRNYRGVRLSPDGRRVVTRVFGSENSDQDVFIYDLAHLARDILTRFTFAPGTDAFPMWTPDGSRVVFTSDRDGQFNLYSKAADGTGDVERLTTSPVDIQSPASWSPDGEMLVVAVVREETGGQADVGVLSMDGDHSIEWLLDTDFREAYHRVAARHGLP